MLETASVTPHLTDKESPGPLARESSGSPVAVPTTVATPALLTDPTPPAALDRVPGRWERLAWYAGTVLLACVLVFTGLRLDRADIRAPFYYDLDSLLILPMVKATVERGPGGHWRNEHTAAPGVMELHDFPVIDHLHFGIIWLISKVVPNAIVVYNLYFLLTFPLAAASAMWVWRYLGLTLPAAAVGGLLYAFLPYHYHRWEHHYFLSAYWMVPVSLVPAFALCRGEFPFFRRTADGTVRRYLTSWRTFGYVVLAAAVAMAGAYYAFFACAVIAFAGVYAWVVFRDWRAVASAGAVVATVVAVGVIQHIPTIRYQWKYGSNPVTDRIPGEADHYGMKIAHLLLPVPDHNLRVLANLRARYLAPERPSEGENAGSLGFLGVAGLVGLFVLVLFPYRRTWPYGPLASLTLFTILLATIGGLGSIFNLIVTAQIRAYNRSSVFVAFLCLTAALWAIDRFWMSHPKGVSLQLVARGALALLAFVTVGLAIVGFWDNLLVLAPLAVIWVLILGLFAFARYRAPEVGRHWAESLRARTLPPRTRYLAWAMLFVFGFLDQTPYAWFKAPITRTLDEQASRFWADARFFHAIEDAMPPGTMVFCLPYAPFPEYPPIERMPVYEHSRGYLHTQSLAWSYGAVKGREIDAWHYDVVYHDKPNKTEETLNRIVYRGFDGLFIDFRGFALSKDGNRGALLVNELNRLYALLVGNPAAKLPEIVHEDGRQVFLDLRPYRELLKKNPYYERNVREEREWVAVIWLGGFYSAEPPGHFNLLRQGPPDGRVMFINPSDRTRTFKVWMSFGTDQPGPFQMRLSGLVDEEFTLDKPPTDYTPGGIVRHLEHRCWEVHVPPGRHAIRIRCTPPPHFIPADHRKFCYFIMHYQYKEVVGP